MAGKGGKWRKFRGQFPTYEEHPGHFAKVQEEKDRILGGAENSDAANASRLGKLYVEARQEKDQIETALKEVNVRLQALIALLFDRLEGEDLEALTMANGVTLALSDDVLPYAADKNLLMDWVRKTKQQSILIVHPKTLQSIVKECLQSGQPVPPGVSVFMKRNIRPTGLKGIGGNGDEE